MAKKNQVEANEQEAPKPPVEQTPQVEETPQEQTPVVDETPQEQTPVVDETPQEQTPAVEETPQEQTPAVEETPEEQTPVIEQTPEEIEIEEQPIDSLRAKAIARNKAREEDSERLLKEQLARADSEKGLDSVNIS